MTYAVKEMFYSLQGEGRYAGRPAVFVRFAGCNLWTGREEDRATAVCTFCDTDFRGIGPDGGTYHTAEALAADAYRLWPWPAWPHDTYVVFTGGEPMLQADETLLVAFREHAYRECCFLGIETNGTIEVGPSFDHVCVSPKYGTTLVQRYGDELKIVYPQAGAEDSWYEEQRRYTNFYRYTIQPRDDGDAAQNAANTKAAAEFVLSHEGWVLGVQLHKLAGLR